MKRILFIILLLTSTAAFGQTFFHYNKYINEYWGDKWEDSNESLYSDQYGYVLKGTYDEFIIYYVLPFGNNYPSDYIMRIKIIGLNTDIDKKEKKRRLKNNEWYQYSGTVEYYTDHNFSTLEQYIRSWPSRVNRDEKRRNVTPATIKIAPYKKKPEVYNIYFGGYGIGISLK